MFGTIRDKRCDKYTHPGISAQKKASASGLTPPPGRRKSRPLAKRKRANPANAFRKHLIRPHETYAKFSQFSVIGRYQLSGLLRRLRNVSSGMSGLPRRATRSARKDGSPRRRAKRIRLKKRLPL